MSPLNIEYVASTGSCTAFRSITISVSWSRVPSLLLTRTPGSRRPPPGVARPWRGISTNPLALGVQDVLHLHGLDDGQGLAVKTSSPSATAIETTRPGIGESRSFEVSGGTFSGMGRASSAWRGGMTARRRSAARRRSRRPAATGWTRATKGAPSISARNWGLARVPVDVDGRARAPSRKRANSASRRVIATAARGHGRSARSSRRVAAIRVAPKICAVRVSLTDGYAPPAAPAAPAARGQRRAPKPSGNSSAM